VETPDLGSIVVGFSMMGRKCRCPLEDAFQGKKVSWGRGVNTTFRLFEVTDLSGTVVASGIAAGTATDQSS
jgi:hypothetical protein